MTDLSFNDATALAAKIQNKEISSVELLNHYLTRVDKYNGEINAIIQTQIEHAQKRAQAADDALAKGESWGPLHGVPITVKESFDIKGLPSTWGIPEMKNNIAQEDAVACQRLQNAGAIIFGKTNVPLLLADLQSYNDIYGTTNNPWDLSRGPGGSSGGAAAAIAAGLTGLEIGTDIGGSIRNPAHFCGVFGHKSTWGILPMRGHALPGVLSPVDISVMGPLARSARDLRLVMEVVGGADELASPGWSLNLPKPQQQSLADYKIAVWADDSLAPVDQSVKDKVLAVAQLVTDAGGSTNFEARPQQDASFHFEQYQALLHSALSARQPESAFQANLARKAQLSENDNSDLANITRASTLYYRDWHQHNESRTQLRWAWHEFFKQYDVLIMPTSLSSAFKHDQSRQLGSRTLQINGVSQPYFNQIFWAGLTGVSYLPSTIVPVGLDAQGLPIGVQIVGPEMSDLNTIAFAEKAADELGGFMPPPNYRN